MRRFEELDYQPTPIGAVSLRRRHDPQFDTEVYEIKIDDEEHLILREDEVLAVVEK